MTDVETKRLADSLAASVGKDSVRLPTMNRKEIDALTRALATGFAPPIQHFVAREISAALTPLLAQLESIEEELAAMRKFSGRSRP